MKLVIAEKPSVAMSLAAVLGANEKKDGYMEGGGYLVSWCVGHLLELAQPEAYGERYARWRYGDLPILPETWKYEVPKDKKKQLAAKRRELSKAKKRIAEIDALIQKIYEDNALGKLPDARYEALDAQYAKEQDALNAEIAELEKAVTGYEQSRKSAEKFIALIDKYENFDTLTNTIHKQPVGRI